MWIPLADDWQFHETDADMMLSVTASPFPTSMPTEFIEPSYAWSVSDDSPSQHATLSGRLSDQNFLVDQVQNCVRDPELSFQLLSSSAIIDCQAEQPTFADGSYDHNAESDQIAIPRDSAGPKVAEFEEQQSHYCQKCADAAPEWVIKRRPRTQNHSCDPCRKGKKACDLQTNIVITDKKTPSISCSTCETRGIECTIKWLASRQSSQMTKQRAQTASRSGEPFSSLADDSVQLEGNASEDLLVTKNPAPLPSCETELVRQLTARKTCLHQFYLYVNMVECPWLSVCPQSVCLPHSHRDLPLFHHWAPTSEPLYIGTRLDPGSTTAGRRTTRPVGPSTQRHRICILPQACSICFSRCQQLPCSALPRARDRVTHPSMRLTNGSPWLRRHSSFWTTTKEPARGHGTSHPPRGIRLNSWSSVIWLP